MLRRWQRVVLDKDNTITDVSLPAQNGTGFNFDLSGNEYLYIGQYYPFNAAYFSLSGGAATATSGIAVQYWDGNSFIDAVDLIDDTEEFTVSGVLQWQPNKDNGWTAVSDTSDESGFPLSAFSIYDLYWARVKVTGSLPSDLECKLLKYKFCKHEDLADFDPEINEYLVPWGGASKTNWDAQILIASEAVVAELKMRGLIIHEGQILRFDDVYEATIYKTLMLIYGQLGDSFNSKFDKAKSEYDSRMSKQRWTFDRNKDAMVTTGEVSNTVVEIER